jgi:hypothetical protein
LKNQYKKLIRYDSKRFDINKIQSWWFSKKYWFKTDYFYLQIKLVLMRDFLFWSHFISTNRHNTDILIFHNFKPIQHLYYLFLTNSTFLLLLFNRFNIHNLTFKLMQHIHIYTFQWSKIGNIWREMVTFQDLENIGKKILTIFYPTVKNQCNG